MNEVRLTGKVLNCYVHNVTGVFICKTAVVHDHYIGNQTISCVSVFTVVMQNENKGKHLDILPGDKVMITGYLKVDHKTSATGNDHASIRVYAKEIELVKPKEDFDMVDYTRIALGM